MHLDEILPTRDYYHWIDTANKKQITRELRTMQLIHLGTNGGDEFDKEQKKLYYTLLHKEGRLGLD